MEDRIPHEEERRGGFDEVAERAAKAVSGGPFFTICVVLVLGWIPTLWMLGAEPAQFILQTVIAVVTLLLVALLQNSQERSEEAMNLKLDAIAHGVADLMRYHTGKEDDLSDNIERLAKTVGIEERLSTKSGRTVADP